jgi:hypothetical protein
MLLTASMQRMHILAYIHACMIAMPSTGLHCPPESLALQCHWLVLEARGETSLTQNVAANAVALLPAWPAAGATATADAA